MADNIEELGDRTPSRVLFPDRDLDDAVWFDPEVGVEMLKEWLRDKVLSEADPGVGEKCHGKWIFPRG